MKVSHYVWTVLSSTCIASAIEPKTTILSREAQDLFDWSMHVQDNRYDTSYNFISYTDKGSWSVRFTAWYLAGLLYRNEGDDLSKAKAAINNILACQMRRDFDAPWYGTEFVGTQLVQVVEEFGQLLGSDLVAKIEDSLGVAAIGGMRRNGTSPKVDNLGLYYSNPAIMRALVVGWIGARRNNKALIDFANDQGTKLLQLFQLNGANTLSEYNSPGYYGIDTWALGAQLKYGPKDQTMTSSAKIILREMWTDMADHYNGYLGNFVGPYDRAYTRDMTQHSTALINFLWGMFGHSAIPLTWKMEGDLLFDIVQGAAIALVIETVKSVVPTPVQEKLRGTFIGPSRYINKTIYDDLEGKHSRTATSWISRELMIGGESFVESVNRGDQFVPAIVHWAGDKTHKPSPLNTFFSLYPSASSIHAVATPNHLSVSYPNRTEAGSDIFTFALSNVPPSWTLSGKTITGLDGELPCVEIGVDAPGLEPQPVVYGSSLRNHVFYNISYVVPEDFQGVPKVDLDITYTC
ncbi:hypothetical protein BU23DRAFT_600153 [Bimuria novae-zelandiae CBS 107.79]|uniref:Uncharacterized protein n=1 Tax=Bimuria novae-zelandiae CBS 107.79 TaxID=1447943 RepID=A0A6A5VED4_9PLEO|nr:hypothetical protein BU23DRAFT_600153 [Bimuria novae-zelandiae CBS 107.79]